MKTQQRVIIPAAPQREELMKLGELNLAKITEVDKAGCEGIADFLYEYINTIFLPDFEPGTRVWCSRNRFKYGNASWSQRRWRIKCFV